MTLLRRHSILGAASALLTSLISYWKLDESSGNAIDSKGLNNGTVVGATQGAAGKVGTAYSFDGNDYINIDNIVNDLTTTTKGTWMAWVKPVDATPASVLEVISFGDANANTFFDFKILTTGPLRVQLQPLGVTKWALDTDVSPFSNNTWTHIAIVQDGTSPVLYADGVAVAQTFIVGTDKTFWFNDFSGLDTGRISALNHNSAGNTLGFNGIVDEVGIWDRALTADEITELYNSGNGLTYPF